LRLPLRTGSGTGHESCFRSAASICPATIRVLLGAACRGQDRRGPSRPVTYSLRAPLTAHCGSLVQAQGSRRGTKGGVRGHCPEQLFCMRPAMEAFDRRCPRQRDAGDISVLAVAGLQIPLTPGMDGRVGGRRPSVGTWVSRPGPAGGRRR
jgi:hypothetical protein